MEYRELKQRIINHYGENHQLAKAIEEQTELIHVIARRLQSGKWDKAAFCEELTDVYAMLDQVRLIYCQENNIALGNLNTRLGHEMEAKLNRTEQQMYHKLATGGKP